ncbi:hypothetical protein J1614_009197 [Plenodomus biglobosus]|nr:hypothetical protein J1614_009197 [Plenodomus biglobosus]
MPRAPVACSMPIVGPLLGDKGQDEIDATLANQIRSVLRLGTSEAPKAIVIITLHWRPEHPTVTATAEPPLYHDFEADHPPQAWEIVYKAPGSTEVAERVYEVLTDAGLNPVKDLDRGMPLYYNE